MLPSVAAYAPPHLLQVHAAHRLAAGVGALVLALVAASWQAPPVVLCAVAAVCGAGQVGLALRDLRHPPLLRAAPGPLLGVPASLRTYFAEQRVPELEPPRDRVGRLAAQLLSGWGHAGPAERPFGIGLVVLSVACVFLIALAFFLPALGPAAGLTAAALCFVLVGWYSVASHEVAARHSERTLALRVALDPVQVREQLTRALGRADKGGHVPRLYCTEPREQGDRQSGARLRLLFVAETAPQTAEPQPPPAWNEVGMTSIGGALVFVGGIWFLLNAAHPIEVGGALLGAWIGHMLLFLARSSLGCQRFESDVVQVEVGGSVREELAHRDGLDEVLCRTELILTLRGDRVLSASRPEVTLANLLPWGARHPSLGETWRAPRALLDSAQDEAFPERFEAMARDVERALAAVALGAPELTQRPAAIPARP